jgi:hypothetical protein
VLDKLTALNYITGIVSYPTVNGRSITAYEAPRTPTIKDESTLDMDNNETAVETTSIESIDYDEGECTVPLDDDFDNFEYVEDKMIIVGILYVVRSLADVGGLTILYYFTKISIKYR